LATVLGDAGLPSAVTGGSRNGDTSHPAPRGGRSDWYLG